MAAQVSIGDAPRATELSPQELTLCASLQLLPGHYLRLKVGPQHHHTLSRVQPPAQRCGVRVRLLCLRKACVVGQ